MNDPSTLRPVTRRMLALRSQGIGTREIARRFNRSPAHVERVLAWSALPRTGPPVRRVPRAIERRVLALRSAGESHEAIGMRFRRSARYIRQVEGLAHLAVGRRLLGGS